MLKKLTPTPLGYKKADLDNIAFLIQLREWVSPFDKGIPHNSAVK